MSAAPEIDVVQRAEQLAALLQGLEVDCECHDEPALHRLGWLLPLAIKMATDVAGEIERRELLAVAAGAPQGAIVDPADAHARPIDVGLRAAQVNALVQLLDVDCESHSEAALWRLGWLLPLAAELATEGAHAIERMVVRAQLSSAGAEGGAA